LGDITVFDVPALVLPDDRLWQNLLGMAFLSRLKRYDVADGRMVLEQ
ncbi:MAG: TIGR02281 family clan AA aspartic protease, partial [Pseudolabrys sp.]